MINLINSLKSYNTKDDYKIIKSCEVYFSIYSYDVLEIVKLMTLIQDNIDVKCYLDYKYFKIELNNIKYIYFNMKIDKNTEIKLSMIEGFEKIKYI